jgi:hypothetical protein
MSDPSPSAPHTSPGHETTDADVKPILQFLVGLGLLMVAVMIGMAFLFNFFEAQYLEEGKRLSPVVDTRQIPPEPRLQSNPAVDLGGLRAWEAEQLNSYGWVDETTGIFRIPIERAMELTVENGLPARGH